jgi:hypothetical protein
MSESCGFIYVIYFIKQEKENLEDLRPISVGSFMEPVARHTTCITARNIDLHNDLGLLSSP